MLDGKLDQGEVDFTDGSREQTIFWIPAFFAVFWKRNLLEMQADIYKKYGIKTSRDVKLTIKVNLEQIERFSMIFSGISDREKILTNLYRASE